MTLEVFQNFNDFPKISSWTLEISSTRCEFLQRQTLNAKINRGNQTSEVSGKFRWFSSWLAWIVTRSERRLQTYRLFESIIFAATSMASQFNFVTRVHILSLADPKRKITQIKNKKIPTHLFFIPFYLCVHRLGFLDTKEGLSPIDSGVNNI